jgi:hypothetical protein
MAAIKILYATAGPESGSMVLDHKSYRSVTMKSDFPFSPNNSEKENELTAPSSRFVDEKISDETGTETKADSALKPAGLSNPFWN